MWMPSSNSLASKNGPTSWKLVFIRGISITPTQTLPQRTPLRGNMPSPLAGETVPLAAKPYMPFLSLNSFSYGLCHATSFKSCGLCRSWGNIKEAEAIKNGGCPSVCIGSGDAGTWMMWGELGCKSSCAELCGFKGVSTLIWKWNRNTIYLESEIYWWGNKKHSKIWL